MNVKQIKRVAVVGGGIAGLTAALRLAERGCQVDLYEAAPALGGRTKSFYDETCEMWVDNGPHLMVGAYQATRQLLADIGASSYVTWQQSLILPLWDKNRGFFALQAATWLPVNVALVLGVYQMPNHGWPSVKAMLKVAMTMHNRDEEQTVGQWMEEVEAPDVLVRDMMEVLCLGVMNETLETANAKTFARVLTTSFSSHQHAKMGWFNKPLSQALIEPMADKLRDLGVNMELRHTVRKLSELDHDIVVLAIPAFARNRLLGIRENIATQAITNVHLWFATPVEVPMMVGLLGTYSQWLFDVSMMAKQNGLHHLCVTVSADTTHLNQDECIGQVKKDVALMLGKKLPDPIYSRLIREKRATVLVRQQQKIDLPSHVFDACESPCSGELPATIELAVMSGEKAAMLVTKAAQINA